MSSYIINFGKNRQSTLLLQIMCGILFCSSNLFCALTFHWLCSLDRYLIKKTPIQFKVHDTVSNFLVLFEIWS